jgi:hypothetical protein
MIGAKSLDICVRSEEVDAANSRSDHSVDGIPAASPDTNDLDAGSSVASLFKGNIERRVNRFVVIKKNHSFTSILELIFK